MPRRNRRREVEPLRPLGSGSTRRDEWRGDGYTVRSVAGADAAKDYRCPGCAQLIPAGTPHVVAWPADDADAAERRHWHRACWDARERRRPG